MQHKQYLEGNLQHSNTFIYQKKEKYELNNLNFHFRTLEEKEQLQPKEVKIKEIINIRGEINKFEKK